MGREIRRVIPNWEDPKEKGDYKPLFDNDFDTKITEWYEGYLLWKKGEHLDQINHHDYEGSFSEWNGDPPREEYYRPAWKEEPTWYQIYETVSEGTPVSPPFETKEELVNYLVEHGDFWDQRRGDGGWKRKNAEDFVNAGWAPSGWIHVGETGFMTPRDGVMKKDL